MQAANSNSDPIQDKGIPRLILEGEKKKFLPYIFICMSWPVSQLSSTESSWKVTLEFYQPPVNKSIYSRKIQFPKASPKNQ